MAKISIDGIKSQKKLFHNVWINVYPTTLPLEEIHFWKENNRTIFTFDRLLREKNKKSLSQLSVEEITAFVAEQPIHKLDLLSKSIERNGVQVPIIVRDDGTLLDGNRRFFACQLLKIRSLAQGKPVPSTLLAIPVWIIRKSSLNETLQLKIIAEANFVPDLKVRWSLDAQARAVNDYYQRIRKGRRLGQDAAILEVQEVFGIQRQHALALLETLQLTKRFIRQGASAKEKIKRHWIVENNFIFFWEFRNKATKGSGALTRRFELADVTNLFFNLMAKGTDNPIKNFKQVEPLVRARHDSTAWALLKRSKGAKLSVVVAMMDDKRELRKAEDRIRIFLKWLKDTDEFTQGAKKLLLNVVRLATKKSGG